MFIDIHGHAWVFPGPMRNGHQAFATPEQLIERYDAIGIERAVMLPEVNPECTYGPQSNQEVLYLACHRYPERFIPFCNIDPRSMHNSVYSPLGDLLEYYKSMGCKGVGEVCANLPFNHPLVENLFKHVEVAGLPLTFHISTTMEGGDYGLYDDPGLPMLEEALRKFPKLIFLGHSQPFWAEIASLETPESRAGYPKGPVKEEGAVVRLMRAYPNLHGDLSAGSGCNALSRDSDYAARFLTEFQDRLYFGTDICAPDTPTPLVDFLLKMRTEKRISEEVFQKVARENAKRLLGL